MSLAVTTVPTPVFEGQKPGTSGLRKKVKVVMQEHYLNNFVQCAFDAVKASGSDVENQTLVVGGDGRFYNDVAIQMIIKMAVANGVTRLWVAKDGFMSTPACSAVIREKGPVWQKAFGAFILTASHNPGGIEEDFGIKYNCENGGPAPDKITTAIHQGTTTITEYKICNSFPDIDVSTIGDTKVVDGDKVVVVSVVDMVTPHVALLKTVFDFGAIKTLLGRSDFSAVFDCMHGVQGPYAKAVLCDELGAPASALINAVPTEDFNGHHADPNLTYATDLTKVMGVDRKGLPVSDVEAASVPAFGCAFDGDADRNMILGRQFFVTPSDSLAVIVAHANVIPFFKEQGGLRAAARSMPTSGALDRVAKELGIKLFETPTGWKYFGNVMDSKAIFNGVNYTPFICGEESFGTGSDHVREKDGMWAVLAWLSILAHYNPESQPSGDKPFVSVEDIVRAHWKKYGRNYYCRYDYEGVDKPKATAMVEAMATATAAKTGRKVGDFVVETADVFEYTDPIDGSVAKNQGIRFLMEDGSRVVFRLSGTAGAGATIRMYLEKYEPNTGDLGQITGEAMEGLVNVALELSNLVAMTGREEPTVIT